MLYTVLGIVFVLLTPIFIFSIRNIPENISVEIPEPVANEAVEFINTTSIEAVETTSADDTTL